MSDVPAVYKAIVAVQGELAEIGIKKEQENRAQHWKFRGIDDLYNALAKLLTKHKLCILPRLVSVEVSDHTSPGGSAMFHAQQIVEFDFVSAEDGSLHTVKIAGEALDSSDKSINKSFTAAFKYLCFQVFCIPVGEAEDADKDSPEVLPGRATPSATNPMCPTPDCGKQLFKSKEEYGGGWFCWKQKGGCGKSFKKDDPKLVGNDSPPPSDDEDPGPGTPLPQQEDIDEGRLAYLYDVMQALVGRSIPKSKAKLKEYIGIDSSADIPTMKALETAIDKAKAELKAAGKQIPEVKE